MNTGTESDASKENKSPNLPIFAEKQISNPKKSNARYLSIHQANTQSQLLAPPNKPCHRRRTSHTRQKSIYFPPETGIESVITSLKPQQGSHNRNLSDADSVVYLSPADKDLNNSEKNSFVEDRAGLQLSIIETATGSLLGAEKSPALTGKREMPCLGSTETMWFCRYCRKDVHTKVEINSCYNSKILRAVSKFVGCCSYPSWIAEYFVHKCPECSLVLGKSR